MDFIDKQINKYGEEKLTNWFKKICFAEAISWILLLSAMVWIRISPQDLAPTIYIIIVGNIHGLFFSLCLLLLLPMRRIFKWDDEDSIIALIAVFFPFATIWMEKKLVKHDRE